VSFKGGGVSAKIDLQTLLTRPYTLAYVSPIAHKCERTAKGLYMTRKDFELIARVIKAQRAPHNDSATLDELTREFAYALEETNPRFDSFLFLRACGVKA
jgi:hypothetical protein